MKFKIGDKVKVVNEAFCPHIWNGTIGKIIEIKSDSLYYLDTKFSSYPFTEDELLLVNNKKQKIKLP